MTTKILVVDYNEPDLEILIRQSFRKRIVSKELEFIFAHTGPNAIAVFLKDLDIEIVLTDVKMQLEEGVDLLLALSETKRFVKTIVLTPYGDIESIRTAMNRGAFDFVTRPIDLKELELTIIKTIDQIGKMRAMEKVKNTLVDIEKELDVAKSIQNSIIPHDFSPLDQYGNFEIYGTMIPARRVGGDFFDFFALDKDRLAITIADVSGKGVPAALFMTMTRGLIRALGQKTGSPIHCLEQLNELLALENESSMFVTAFYGILNAKTGVIEYCNAGHNPPYLVHEDGSFEQIGRSQGIALGVIKDSTHFVQNELHLKKGDTFLLYTDGVTEAMNANRQLFSEKRLEDVLRVNAEKPLKVLLEKILIEVETFSGDTEQSDDITLLALKITKEAL